MATVKNKNDSNKKVHFNVVDACIIVLIVAIILGMYFRFIRLILHTPEQHWDMLFLEVRQPKVTLRFFSS